MDFMDLQEKVQGLRRAHLERNLRDFKDASERTQAERILGQRRRGRRRRRCTKDNDEPRCKNDGVVAGSCRDSHTRRIRKRRRRRYVHVRVRL